MTDLDKLRDQLDAALSAKDDENLIPALNPSRNTVALQLSAVMNYLADQGVEAELRAPLMSLLSALSDIDAGRNNPYLTVRNTGAKRRSMPMDEQALMALASAGITVLKEQYGLSIEKAAKQVAGHLRWRPSSVPATNETELWIYLKDWRKALKVGRKDQTIHDLYGRFVKKYSDHDKESLLRVIAQKAREKSVYLRET